MAETKRITVPAAEELLGLYFPILDHGFMALKDYMSGDDGIEEAARGSYKYGTRQKGDQRQLLRSLMRRRHTSPFEQVELKFHCCMPIVVARQWVRHRTASLNEMSGRYSLMPMLFYTPQQDQVQKQSKWDKQGRDGAFDKELLDEHGCNIALLRDEIRHHYRWCTENDIARELARIDLPLSTYTQWVWKIDGHNFFHALGLRCDSHAQWETRQYFNWMAGAGKRIMPIAFEAWEDYAFYSKKFSRQEMNVLRYKLEHGHCINDGDLGLELTKTERKEFIAKFEEPEIIDFDLDLSQAKEPEFFEEKFREAAEGG
jgi:thymidylate synthase (FAD)